MDLEMTEPLEWTQVDLAEPRTAFRPGETVEGTASWSFTEPPELVELRLFWWTEGRGDRDVEVVETVPFPAPAAQERRSFRVTLPAGPWSFHGKLISLLWGLEVVVEPGYRPGLREITVSPSGEPVVLHPGAEPGAEPAEA